MANLVKLSIPVCQEKDYDLDVQRWRVFFIQVKGGRESDPTALYQGGVADYQQCQAGAGVA